MRLLSDNSFKLINRSCVSHVYMLEQFNINRQMPWAWLIWDTFLMRIQATKQI